MDAATIVLASCQVRNALAPVFHLFLACYRTAAPLSSHHTACCLTPSFLVNASWCYLRRGVLASALAATASLLGVLALALVTPAVFEGVLAFDGVLAFAGVFALVGVLVAAFLQAQATSATHCVCVTFFGTSPQQARCSAAVAAKLVRSLQCCMVLVHLWALLVVQQLPCTPSTSMHHAAET